MNSNLRLVINNINEKKIDEKHFFEKNELKIILNLYAKMVSDGSLKDYGLNISNKQVGFALGLSNKDHQIRLKKIELKDTNVLEDAL